MDRGLSHYVEQLSGDSSPAARRSAVLAAVKECSASEDATLDLQQHALCLADFEGEVLDALRAVTGRLRVLNLFMNELTALPQWIGDCPNLEELHGGCNPLEELDAAIFEKLPKLRELDLGYGNKLTTVPPTIASLKSLKTCWLGNNRIQNIPPALFDIPALEELHLYGNDIVDLPESIGCCSSLRNLNLGRNQLTSIPPEMGKLAKLEILQLYENSLTALPKEMLDIPNLKTLGLHGNPGLAIPPSAVLVAGPRGSIEFYSKL